MMLKLPSNQRKVHILVSDLEIVEDILGVIDVEVEEAD
jgi:hypothetical protein